MRLPDGLKVFLLSLLAAAFGGYTAFRLAFWLAMKLISGEHKEALALAVAVLSSLLVGVASAVTAGVLSGKRRDA